MIPLSDDEAIARMNVAQLEKGHVLTTREQYQQWVRRYREAGSNAVISPMDYPPISTTTINTIPFHRTA